MSSAKEGDISEREEGIFLSLLLLLTRYVKRHVLKIYLAYFYKIFRESFGKSLLKN